MLTCKQASHLISQRQDRALRFRERSELRIHLWICANCRRFERQIGVLRQLLSHAVKRAETEAAAARLSEAARRRISQAMDERLANTEMASEARSKQ